MSKSTSDRQVQPFRNPFRPGAGHAPPFLAGRDAEIDEFAKLLKQKVILSNFILTGLRGVGKTVLLDELKPRALAEGWLWVGTDMSESTCISEETMAVRILADISAVTSSLTYIETPRYNPEYSATSVGFAQTPPQKSEIKLNYDVLRAIYDRTPGLVEDKIKSTLEIVWVCFSQQQTPPNGVIFAYDEAQNLSDQAEERQYPLSMLLSVFQSLQKKSIPFMLVLTGLPTLFPKLVEARTFAERMFHVQTLDRLDEKSCKEAILNPIKKDSCPVTFDPVSVSRIIETSGGYPYFIQFICREVYDVFIQQSAAGQTLSVPVNEIVRKLDTDFFAGRWARATDRQRELLKVIAGLENAEDEFTVQEIVAASKVKLEKGFSPSHANHILGDLCDAGLVYKNRYGKYSFAVPLLGKFILRQDL